MNPLPLSDGEIERLDRFLLDLPGEAMDVAMLDGFLTAIVSGPKVIMPSEWMRWVWDVENGTDEPEFESETLAREIIGLMIRHMNDIAMTLMDHPDEYQPLLMERRTGSEVVPVIDEWCMGFMKGIKLDPGGWQPVTSDHPEWLFTISLYGTEAGWKLLEDRKLSMEAHKSLAAGLAADVRKIYAFWLEQRRPGQPLEKASALRQPFRREHKIGRNDPCPCGSGKKFKHCHGAPGALH